MVYIYSGTIGSELFLSEESVEVLAGASVVNTTIDDGALLVIDGGAEARNSMVLSGGTLALNAGAIHRGALQIDANAVVIAADEAIIELPAFDSEVVVSGLDLISGTPTYTINIADAVASGSAALAVEVENFTSQVVVVDGETILGTLQLDGGTVSASDKVYSLALNEGVLTLSVAAAETPKLTKGSGNTITTNVYGDGAANVGDESINAKVFGGWLVSSAGMVSDPSITTVTAEEGVFIKATFGGSAISVAGGTARLNGSAAANISGDLSANFAIGGHFVVAGTALIYGNTTLTIASGSYNNFICGGSVVCAGATASVYSSNTLNISGGVFNNVVAGASLSQGGFITSRNINATLNISGGTFNSRIFGGNIASRQEYAVKNALSTTLIDIKGSNSSININIDCSTNKIVFNDHIVAGSYNQGSITGSTTVRITGVSENLVFDHVLTGDCTSGGEQNFFVKGSRNLIFDNFTGDFNASGITAFSTLSFINDTVIDFTQEVKVSMASSWTFELGSSLNWMTGTNNFRGDSLTLDFGGKTLDGEWTIINGSLTTCYAGFDGMKVKINGETATYDYTNKYYTSANYRLFLENSGSNYCLKLAALA